MSSFQARRVSRRHGEQMRRSVAIKHQRRMTKILSLDPTQLSEQIAYRGDHISELRYAARDFNRHNRAHYADFIHEVGRNIFPLIIATDHEEDYSGVGTTFTLFLEDGSETKVAPSLGSNYELYKSCGHIFMGLGVVIGPYMANASMCSNEIECEEANRSHHIEIEEDLNVSWLPTMRSYIQKIKAIKQALTLAEEVEAIQERADDNGELSDEAVSTGDTDVTEADTSYGLPPPEMLETLRSLLHSVITFCEDCVSTGTLDVSGWKTLNETNFPRIKTLMQAATRAQADACIRQLLKWKAMLGPELWREVHVIIPTVWAVGGDNPRKEMFRQVLDEDRAETHIICSEWPRSQSDARTLLGRVVGDRAIGRFVFGTGGLDQQVKTHGLSSEIDVLQDDAMPQIWAALEREGCHVKPRQSAVLSKSTVMRNGSLLGTAVPETESCPLNTGKEA